MLVVRAGPDFYKVDIESLKVTLAVKSSNIFGAPGELSTISLQHYLSESLSYVALASC